SKPTTNTQRKQAGKEGKERTSVRINAELAPEPTPVISIPNRILLRAATTATPITATTAITAIRPAATTTLATTPTLTAPIPTAPTPPPPTTPPPTPTPPPTTPPTTTGAPGGTGGPDTAYGTVAKDARWREGLQYCEDQGKRLCLLKEYCPGGAGKPP